jgi:hypothetical protein
MMAALAAIALETPAQAWDGPWCAGQSAGPDGWIENCSMPSFDSCRREVVAGNRGVCFPNPNWMAYQPARRPAGKRKYR